jgi:hypothetical protein
MAGDGSGVTNVLMVTTSVRMVDGVHANTADARPAVALDLVLVVSTTGLEDRLVDATTTGDDADLATTSRVDGLLGTRGQTDAGLAGIRVVADDRGVVARGAANLPRSPVTCSTL